MNPKASKEMDYLYTDIMRDYIWPFYHKWVLHRGRYGTREWLICRHQNPFHILTPRLFDRQVKNLERIESGK